MGKHFDSNSRLDFESHPPVPLTTHSAFVYRDLASVNKVTPGAGLIDRRLQHGGIPRSQRKSTSNRVQSVTAQRLQGQDNEGSVITVSVIEVLSCPHRRAEPCFLFWSHAQLRRCSVLDPGHNTVLQHVKLATNGFKRLDRCQLLRPDTDTSISTGTPRQGKDPDPHAAQRRITMAGRVF